MEAVMKNFVLAALAALALSAGVASAQGVPAGATQPPAYGTVWSNMHANGK